LPIRAPFLPFFEPCLVPRFRFCIFFKRALPREVPTIGLILMVFAVMRLRILSLVMASVTSSKWSESKRGTKQGSKKGSKGARIGKKKIHVAKVRALRYRLKVYKDRKEITNKEFWELYKMVGGNTIRNVAHLRSLIDEIVSKRKS